jgi:hypothetical protein
MGIFGRTRGASFTLALIAAITSVASADDDAKKAEVLATLKASKAYQAAVADRDAKLATKENAAADASPQQKLDYATAYTMARKRVSAMETKALADAGLSTDDPVDQSKIVDRRPKHWVRKANAPAYVQTILDKLPQMKQDVLDDLDRQIVETKAKRKGIAQESVPTVVVGHSPFGGDLTANDGNAVLSKSSRMRDCDKTVLQLYKAKKAIAADPLWLPESVPLKWEVGEIGTLPAAHVIQVIDDKNVIASFGEESFWLAGVDTKKIVDDKDYGFGELVRISGTKRYETVLGQRTVFEVEPFDFNQYVEAVAGPSY